MGKIESYLKENSLIERVLIVDLTKMNKKGKIVFWVVFIFLLLALSLVYSISADSPQPQSDWILWQSTATSDTYKNLDGTYTTVLGVENIDLKNKRYPNYGKDNETFYEIIPFSSDSPYNIYDYQLTSETANYKAYLGITQIKILQYDLRKIIFTLSMI